MFSNNLENIKEIIYNYNKNTVYNYQYEKIPDIDGYLKISYLSNTPNLTLSLPQENINYMTTNLYIFKKFHPSNFEYDAELIIEHIPSTNGFQKLYSCFLLASGSLNYNPLDGLLSKKIDIPLEINSLLLPGLKADIYESNGILYNDIVVVFDKPIYMTSSFENFTKMPFMFTNNKGIAAKIRDIPCIMNDIQNEKKIIEGMTDIPVFCTPIEEIDEANEFTDQIVLPVIGPLSESLQASQLFNYSINFISFFFILMVVYFGAPLFYDKMIIDKTLDNGVLSGIGGVICFNFGILFTISIILISIGTTNPKSSVQYFGIIFLIILFLSIIIISQKSGENYKIFNLWNKFDSISRWFTPSILIGSILGMGIGAGLGFGTMKVAENSSMVMLIGGIIGLYFSKLFDPSETGPNSESIDQSDSSSGSSISLDTGVE